MGLRYEKTTFGELKPGDIYRQMLIPDPNPYDTNFAHIVFKNTWPDSMKGEPVFRLILPEVTALKDRVKELEGALVWVRDCVTEAEAGCKEATKRINATHQSEACYSAIARAQNLCRHALDKLSPAITRAALADKTEKGAPKEVADAD